jgi:hypothetical protein
MRNNVKGVNDKVGNVAPLGAYTIILVNINFYGAKNKSVLPV